jgi:hypothetical protein
MASLLHLFLEQMSDSLGSYLRVFLVFNLRSWSSSGDAQPEQTGQRVCGSRAGLQFECSALVRVREPNHFRASRWEWRK